MVQVRENRSDIVCAPIGEREPGPADGWVQCPIRIEATQPVGGWLHLLADADGREFTALLPPMAAEILPERGEWRVQAELVAPGLVRVHLPDSGDQADRR